MKPVKFQRSAGESVLARMVARVFGVAGSDHWHEVAQRVSVCEANERMPWDITGVRRYPWVVNVPSSMFSCKRKDELIIALVAEPGTMFLVNDSSISGAEGLFLLVADDAANDDNNAGYAVSAAPVNMLVNHAFFPDNTYTIVAIQLTSCLRQPLS